MVGLTGRQCMSLSGRESDCPLVGLVLTPPHRTTASGWKLTSRACVFDPVSTHLHSWVWAAPHPMSEFSKWSRLCKRKHQKIKSLVSLFGHPSGPVCQQRGPYIISDIPSIQCGAEHSVKTALDHCDSGSLFGKRGTCMRYKQGNDLQSSYLSSGSRTYVDIHYPSVFCIYERIFGCWL